MFGGLAFTVPYLAIAILLGPEFPSLIGSSVGLIVVTFAAKRKFLVPGDTWEFDKPAVQGRQMLSSAPHTNSHGLSTTKAWAPYALLGFFLVLTRLRQLPVGAWLQSVRISWPNIFETNITGSTTPFYLPAAILLLVVVITWGLHAMTRKQITGAIRDSTRVLLGAGFVLLFTVPMVRVYINSGANHFVLSGGGTLPSMPIAMATWVADQFGATWPLFAPTIGAMGAFIAGSNTVSNLMFSLFQHGVATQLAISTALVVALQAVGAAAGNMIAIHNVVAASATVGLLGQEGTTLRKTIIPTLYYLAVVGLLGLVLMYVVGVDAPLVR